MTDTIELLETIGKDASLRHAPREALAQALSSLDASEGLKHAAASGSNAYLIEELGYRAMESIMIVNQTAPDEEEGDDDDESGDDDGAKDLAS